MRQREYLVVHIALLPLTLLRLRRIPLKHLTFIIDWIKENVEGAVEFVDGAQKHLERDAQSNLAVKLACLQIEAADLVKEKQGNLLDLLGSEDELAVAGVNDN